MAPAFDRLIEAVRAQHFANEPKRQDARNVRIARFMASLDGNTPQALQQRLDHIESKIAWKSRRRFDASGDSQVAAAFFRTLLDAVTTGHVLHLQTRSYSQHAALNTFYSELDNLVDGLIEAFQGKYGVVDNYPPSTENTTNEPIGFIKNLSDYVRSNRAAVADDSELQNDIDSIQTLIDSTLYKLKNLR
jgi:hypothetical protein